MPSDAELEEQLRNMTPDQLRELQKQQCIFCKIVEKKVQARTVYEDDEFLVALDINPATPGHLLVLPKEHYSILPSMPEETIAHLGMLTKHLSQAVLRGLKAQGSTIFVANGLAAGQRAAHFLLHVIPRMEGDQAGITLPANAIAEADAKKIQEHLQPFVDRAFGKGDASAPSTSAPTPPAAAREPGIAAQTETRTPQGKHGSKSKDDNTGDRKEKSEVKPDEKKGKVDLDALADFLSRGAK
ncbi:HIT family protein [Candidatus Woesearchaeota archaeon]|nr:HIT family protein [Candidatus Woesearchaeota archaeon]